MKTQLLLLFSCLFVTGMTQQNMSHTLQFDYKLGAEDKKSFYYTHLLNQIGASYAFKFNKHWAIQSGLNMGLAALDLGPGDCSVGEPYAHYRIDVYSINIPLVLQTYYHVKPTHKWNYFTSAGIICNYDYFTFSRNRDWKGNIYKQQNIHNATNNTTFLYGFEIGIRRWLSSSYYAGASLSRYVNISDKDDLFIRRQFMLFIGKNLQSFSKK